MNTWGLSELGARERWPRSNERYLRKTWKILERKGCHFHCSKFDTLLPVDLLTFWNFTKKVLSIQELKILSGCGVFKSKEIRSCERNGNIFTLNKYYIYSCSCFHFTVKGISRNKTEEKLPRRFTVADVARKRRSYEKYCEGGRYYPTFKLLLLLFFFFCFFLQ